MTTPQSTQSERDNRETRFIRDFRAGKFVNSMTDLQNPFEIEQWWNKELAEREAEVRREERAFILNVLDGVDIADGTCNTKAIRYALSTRYAG